MHIFFLFFTQIISGLEWTLFVDLQMKEIMHSQSWMLLAYLPFACVSHHLRFASVTWPTIQFPSRMQEVQYWQNSNNCTLLCCTHGAL